MKHRWSSVFWMVFSCVGYLITFIQGFPIVRYFPTSHAWGLAGAYPEPSMAWFGKVAVSLLAGILGWQIGVLAAKAKGPESRPPLALDIAAIVLVCVTAAYTAHYEWVKWM